jgi:hypothetical protein
MRYIEFMMQESQLVHIYAHVDVEMEIDIDDDIDHDHEYEHVQVQVRSWRMIMNGLIEMEIEIGKWMMYMYHDDCDICWILALFCFFLSLHLLSMMMYVCL